MVPQRASDENSRIVSLAFHSLTDRFTFGSTNYSPRRFRQLVEFLHSSDESFALTKIRFTFDDGYAHLLDILPDFVAETSILPIVFIPTAFIGKSNSWDYGGRFRLMRHLNADEIQSLAKAGVVFGSHSHSHCDLTSLSDYDLAEELSVSKKLLSEIIGTSIIDLSYPFGRISPRVESSVAAYGYKAGYTMSFPTGNDSPLKRGRIPVYFFDSAKSVSAKISGRGLRFAFEKVMTMAVQKLSIGTVMLQSIRGRKGDSHP